MDAGSFARYLGRMDRVELAEVLRVRPEVRVAPVPDGPEALAVRLSDRGSLAAVRLVSRDAVAAGQAAAGLGSGATVAAVAALTGGSREAVRSALGELRRVGVAWPDGEVVCLVPPVLQRWKQAKGRLAVTGRPAVELGRCGTDGEQRSSVQHLLRAAYALLDTSRPIVGLRRGGVGVKERQRWGAALGLGDDYLLLVLDVLFAAGLLVQSGTAFGVTARYERWREATPAQQWAELAWAWFWLPHSPTARQSAAVSKVESSRCRAARWAMLRAGRGGLSVEGVAAAAYWFCPTVHQYVEGVVREAVMVGVVAGDALSVCGEALLSAGNAEALAASVAEVVVPMQCELQVLDDLKAVVFGQLTVEAARVLEASAESLVEDGARVWQFTTASVRAAFAQGWTGESLLASLNELTQHNVPWALRALLGERGRGQVSVREVGCCVVAEAQVIAEVVRLPGFVELAPTVAGSVMASTELVAQLQAEGFAVVEDPSSGSVVVRRAPVAAPVDEAEPVDLPDLDAAEPSTAQIVRGRNRRLSKKAVALLAGAIDEQSDVRIDYVDGKGESSSRTITPIGWDGPFLLAWCHMREADRQFRVERIKSVSPVRP
ncbi:helicase-associated domain-containing protein [Actinocrispum wychmicini]|uniref:XPB/Ssl2-like helicase family protein n=1 Tax=Actinocrispum wychmicini TaxID=1213861 RepID=A0A4R2JHZ5_9PSEU|nr:helicase-associated domain-containing protein [Actinocrispum wychmicini]TCO59511.1 XPB/Ssl2-like helicase family protein [Actinocrispum wychmicini]